MIYGHLNVAFPADLEAEEHQDQGPLDGVFNQDDLAPLPKRRRTDEPDILMEGKMQEDATCKICLMWPCSRRRTEGGIGSNEDFTT